MICCCEEGREDAAKSRDEFVAVDGGFALPMYSIPAASRKTTK